MSKILTRFYLEDGAWAKLQYVAALMHKPPKDVAELIMRRELDKTGSDVLAADLKRYEGKAEPKSKGGKK